MTPSSPFDLWLLDASDFEPPTFIDDQGLWDHAVYEAWIAQERKKHAPSPDDSSR